MSAEETALRRRAAAERLSEHRLDALLLSNGANLRYLSGFTGSNAMLLLTLDAAILFTDPRYTIQARGEVSCKVRICRKPLLEEVGRAIRVLGVRRIGFEPARMAFEDYEAARSRLPLKASLEPAEGLVEGLRMVKSPAELELIRASMRTACVAFEQAVRRARPGMPEADLAAEIDYRMRRAGAEKPSFETIVAAGPRSALPHASPTAAPLTGMVLVDMGAFREGYASDMTRMFFCATPPPKARRLYRAVLEAQQAALDTVREGVETATVDRAARRVLRAHGLERAFVHSTGHGLGLEIHEAPRLGRRDKTRLAPGMVVTVEPGAYLEGYGGVRIEDTVIVTATGCEVLTSTGKEIRTLT